jgi:glutamate 5-kinase
MVAALSPADIASPLDEARRIVVKIGSALLVDQESGRIRHDWLRALADDVADLRKRGKEVLIVSSGAIAVGRLHLGLTSPALKLEEKQAAAATGQIRLAHAYEEALARHDLTVAQILLSPEDTERRRRHLNARATMTTLLALGAVPVINENDTVATAEIRFGDNDRLGARVAQMVSADTLLLLSDVDGLYEQDPRSDPNARHIARVERITPEIEAMAGAAGTDHASGGMITKLAAARISTAAGCRMAIIAGGPMNPLSAMEAGARCTWFQASDTPRAARKNWIASAINAAGAVHLDAGAEAALAKGRSLLPAGVTQVIGTFERGDLITVHGCNGQEIARGLAAYGAADAIRIKGHKSREIETILGYRGRDELIHRDDLVLTG